MHTCTHAHTQTHNTHSLSLSHTQVFSNAISYHSSDHKMYKAARRLRKFVSDVALELALELQQADTVRDA